MAGVLGKSGRKPGSKNTRTREIADRLAAEGITPLEYMLRIMRDESEQPERRFDAAKSAAPYMHPKLANVGNADADDKTVQIIVNRFG